MAAVSFYFLLLGSVLVNAYLDPLPGYQLQDGITRVLGSSFGAPTVSAEFDYVIIGGGTAGNTIAKRLAEDPNVTVALVEAGSFYEISNSDYSQVPAFAGYFTGVGPTDYNPLVDWGISTVPQPQLNNRRIHYVAGKTFGGGSARNYMLYQRSVKGAYQMWADQVDDQSYSWNNWLPYFVKSVNFTFPDYSRQTGSELPTDYDSSAYNATGGPLHVTYANYVQPVSDAAVQGFSELGLESIPGFNSGNLIGFGRGAASIDPESQTRSSSETSFLQTGMAAGTNLQVYGQTLARKILFSANKTATGVLVSNDIFNYTLSARKEVILSAGVFRSPQTLMLSGIGPRSVLEAFNIPIVADLPAVGQNFRDQPTFGIVAKTEFPTGQRLANATYAAAAMREYLDEQNGPLTSTQADYIGWEKVPHALRANLSCKAREQLDARPKDWPDFEHIPLSASLYPVNDTADYITFMAILLSFTSVGNVTIASDDPAALPLISPNWLATPEDQELAVRAFKRERQLAAASGSAEESEAQPGPAVQTDAEILEYIKDALILIYHGVGTCAMGRADEANAVVDSRARVRGVTGLRVVDASVFPFLPPGHTQATIYALAEKIADDIKRGP